ncbi:MAG: RagB/SusD family nutrient uptake outer membrane protein [Chitinophaga sp.]|uniref:RagB/SusD family nutrient uptake outer membrane protein n=1 Tax=Chitinophaga sp. TaxID=1869181 RepID=UPI001B110370|nr:RagB/SusD family nutrient uptake outer membrane protein [Chitinophaga sp.]MBO9729640.1 RagB/SusD family nutrient uptake outer membrane protein [Chitinophaga sp.]
MKKQRLYIAYAAAVLSATTLVSSCSKILDLEPHNSTFTGAYFSSESDAKTSLSGAYAILRNILIRDNSWHKYGDVVSGELSIDGGRDNGNYNISNGEYTGLNVGSSNWNWQQYYQLLQQVNLIINKVPGIPDSKFASIDTKRHVIGEAYFLRAFTYFYMSRIWGDVPLKLQPDLDVSTAKNIARSPAADVWKQCLADLEAAKPNLDFGYEGNETDRAVRANKGSAFALQAHILAWKGDYAGAADAANTVITSGGYLLADASNYAKVFIGKSQEGIFEININDAQSEGLSLQNNSGMGVTLSMPFIDGKSYIEWPVNTNMVNYLYADSSIDIRYRTFFYNAQSNQGQIIKFANITYADGSTKKDPRLSNNLIIFRLADIILLRAEMLNKLGQDGDALTLLNKIRKRAGLADVSDTGADLETAILEERLRELYFEGHAYYDLVRTKKLPDYNEHFPSAQFQGGAPTGGWLWPIDPGMFKDDYTLVQTPYWRGKL